jgi:hypothetical protein
VEGRVVGDHVDLLGADPVLPGANRVLPGADLAQSFAHTGLDGVVDFAVVEPHGEV